MALDLVRRIYECLEANPEQRFEAREIAEWIFQEHEKECREKQKKSTVDSVRTTDEGLITQIASEIGARRDRLQKKYPNKIKIIESYPKKYYFSERDDADEIKEAEKDEKSPTSKTDISTPTEDDLYPKLSEFLWSEFQLYSKRINDKRSSNKRGTDGNKWLHPDLVGMEDLSKDWNPEITNCIKVYADKRTKLWSFEVKKLINRSNVRESFFQAVSNSSWANFGYLVAGDIEGSDTLKELRMLASLHGIGFIRLNVDNPSESAVMIPATERREINWDTVNRLAENKDFMGYIKAVRVFYQGDNKIDKADWDYKEDEEL